MTATEARERVARGAVHLDRIRPGWARRIDIGTLTLHDPCGCIVGQLCGGVTTFTFQRALNTLDIWNNDVAFGFELDEIWFPVLGSFEERQRIRLNAYAPLQEAWIEAIADRLVTSGDTKSIDGVQAPEAVEPATV